MKPLQSTDPAAAEGAVKRGASHPRKARRERPQRRALARTIVQRVTPVLDAQTALRTPLRDALRERFCQALLVSNSATAAAIRAGYSPATAKSQASRLLTSVNVQRRLAGLFENTAHRSILRRSDVLRNASARAASALADISDLIGLPYDEFAERIKLHPAGRSIRKIVQGVEYDRESKTWSKPYIKSLELFDPQRAEEILSSLLGWEAPKRVELVPGQRGVVMIPEQSPAPLGVLPEPPAGPEQGSAGNGA
jgi:hypothetical protein